MATYVLIHGGWHTGDELSEVADTIRENGHIVHTPTLKGNRPGDTKKGGLDEAVQSVVDYISEKNLSDFVLVGHSYAGFVISKVADILPEKVRRLVYWNAFVPFDGDSVSGLGPKEFVLMLNHIAEERGDGSVVLPFIVWREMFMNDADLELAQSSYDKLNPQPYRTFTDKISLSKPLAELEIGKSYINGRLDNSMPHAYTWHPTFSERLGLFRLVELEGSHEVCFTNPRLLGEKIIEAGRD